MNRSAERPSQYDQRAFLRALAVVLWTLLLTAGASVFGQGLGVTTTLSSSTGGQNPANIYCADRVTITTDVLLTGNGSSVSPGAFKQTFPAGCVIKNVQVVSLNAGDPPSTTWTLHSADSEIHYTVSVGGGNAPPHDRITFDLIIPCWVKNVPVTHAVLPTSPPTTFVFYNDHVNPFNFVPSVLAIQPISPNSPAVTLVGPDQSRQFQIVSAVPGTRTGGFTLTYKPESEIRFNSFTLVPVPANGSGGPPIQLLLGYLGTPDPWGVFRFTIPDAAVAALFPNNGWMGYQDRILMTENYDVLRCSPTSNDGTEINLTWICNGINDAGHAIDYGCNTIPVPFSQYLLVEKSVGPITPRFAINPLHTPAQPGDGDPLVFCYPLPAGTHPSDIVVTLANAGHDVSLTLPGPYPLGDKLLGSAMKTLHTSSFSMRQEDFAESVLINQNDPHPSFPHSQIYVQGSIAGMSIGTPVLVDSIKGFYSYDPAAHRVTLNFDVFSAAYQNAHGNQTTSPYQPLGATGPLVNEFVPEGTPPTGSVYPRDATHPNLLITDNDVCNELMDSGEISLIFKQASFVCSYPFDFYPVTPGSGLFPEGFGFADSKPSVGYLFFGQNGSDSVAVNYDDMSQQFGPPILADSLTWSAGIATFHSLAPHGLVAGQKVDITGAPQPGYNGTFTVAAMINNNEFTYGILSPPGNNVVSAVALSASGNVATITTATPSGYLPGETVVITGASDPLYNGLHVIDTVVADTLNNIYNFTYQVSGTPPANTSATVLAMPASITACGSHSPHPATTYNYGNLHNNFPVHVDSLANTLPDPPGGQDILVHQSALVQFQYGYYGHDPNPSPFAFNVPNLYFDCQTSYRAKLIIPASYQLNSATYYPGLSFSDSTGGQALPVATTTGVAVQIAGGQATGTLVVSGGMIVGASVGLTSGGSGYNTPPQVTVTDATGAGAVITANVSGGQVVSLNIVTPGNSSYSANPTLTIAPPASVAYYCYTFDLPAPPVIPSPAYSGHIDANVTLTNCPDGGFGFDNFTARIQALCNDCPGDACADTIAVIYAQLFEHCPGDCDLDPAPQSTSGFEYYRHTFGTVSEVNTTPIDINTASTKRRFYPCDEVEFVASGSFYPAKGHQLGFRLSYVFGGNATTPIPFQFFAFEHGELKYTPAGLSQQTYTIQPGDLNTVFTTAAGTTPWLPTDPRELYVNFRDPADQNFADALQGAISGHPDAPLSLELHLFATINPMDNTFTAGAYPLEITGEFWGQPSGNIPSKGSCDPGHRSANVLGVTATPVAIISAEGLCSRSFEIRTEVGGGLEPFDEFEGEYRPWVEWPNPITMTLPPGVTLGAASFTVVDRSAYLYGAGEYDLLAHPVDTTTGPIVSFKTYDNGKDWPVLDRNGLPTDLRIQGTLLDHCPPTVDTPVPLSWPYISEFCSTDQDCRKVNTLPDATHPLIFGALFPDISLSTGVFQYHVFSSLTTINTTPLPPAIKFQYLGSSGSHLPNAWIKIVSPDITVNTVRLNNSSSIDVGPGGYFHIGDILAGPNSPAYINLGDGNPITAGAGGIQLHNCAPGFPFDVTVLYGYHCDGYPQGTPNDPTPCFTGNWLFRIYPEPSGLAMQVDPPTETTTHTPIGSPCDSYVYHVALASTMAADLENPLLTITLPAGMSFTSYTYVTSGGASGSLPAPSQSVNDYAFDVNAAYNGNGIPFLEYVDLYFTVTGGCANSPSIAFHATGENICGGQVPDASASYVLALTLTTPTITASGTPLTLSCNPTQTDIENALGTATATTICGTTVALSPFSTSTVSSTSTCGRQQTRTWKFTGACGLSATDVSRTVTWSEDLIGPAFVNCPTATIPLPCHSAPDCTTVAATVAAHGTTVTDPCTGAALTPGCATGTITTTGNQKSQTFTLTATDGCGVSSTCLITYTWPAECAGTCCDNCSPSDYISYTVPILAAPDVNYLVNQLCHGHNLLDEVLGVVPVNGTTVRKWDATAQLYDPPDTYHSNIGWLDTQNNQSLTTLAPGEGFLLSSPVAFNLTFSGCQPTNCFLPCLPHPDGCTLVGRLGIGTAVWTNLSSCPPICGSEIRIWNGTGFNSFDYFHQAWHDSSGTAVPEPVLALGQSAFVCLVNSTNCCCENCATNDYVTFTNAVVAGLNFLANNLCHGTNNTVNDLVTNVPSGTVMRLWNCAAQSFTTLTYYDENDAFPDPAGWFDSFGNPVSVTLAPGDGFILENTSGPFDLIEQGCLPNCPVPCLPQTNCCILRGNLGLSPAAWTNLSRCPPICGTDVRIWNGASYDEYVFYRSAWHDASGNVVPEPIVAPGQSAFVCLVDNTNCCKIVCAPDKTVPCTASWLFDPPSYTGDCCAEQTITLLSSNLLSQDPCRTVYKGVWQVAGCPDVSPTLCTQIVTVADITPPVISQCPTNRILYPAGFPFDPCDIFYPDMTGELVASDDCSGVGAITQDPPEGVHASPGTHAVVFTVCDGCSNCVTCTNYVTVHSPIVMNCPTNITVDCTNETAQGVLVNYTMPAPYSLCCQGAEGLSCAPPPNSTFTIGVTLVTCTAWDSCGDTNTCTFTITVRGYGVGDWKWARKSGGNSGDSGNGIAADRQGNIVVAGSFSSSISFAAPNPNNVGPLSGFGSSDIFVAKYDATGALLWAVRAGGTGPDRGNGVAVDESGNVYVTGDFFGSAAFESIGGPTLSVTSSGSIDAFVAKYDPSGKCLWVQKDGGLYADHGAGVAVTPSGSDVFIIGDLRSSSGIRQASVRHFSGGTGALVGPAQVTSPTVANPSQFGAGTAIAMGSGGRVYVAGFYLGATTFGGFTVPGPANGQGQCFIAAFGPGLTPLWVRHSGYTLGATPSCTHVPSGIAVTPSGLWCYLAGAFNGTANFGNNVYLINTRNNACPNQLHNYFVAKFDAASGAPQWAVQGANLDPTSDDQARGIAVDGAGNPYVTGFIHPNSPSASVNDGPVVLVAAYDPLGALRWTHNAADGPLPPNAPAHNVGLGIALDDAGCVHLAGAFTEDLQFTSVATLNSTPNNVQDVFVSTLCPPCGCEPVYIAEQPKNWGGVSGPGVPSVSHPVTFTVAVNGTPPISIIWRRNGVPVNGPCYSVVTIPTAFGVSSTLTVTCFPGFLFDTGIYSAYTTNACSGATATSSGAGIVYIVLPGSTGGVFNSSNKWHMEIVAPSNFFFQVDYRDDLNPETPWSDLTNGFLSGTNGLIEDPFPNLTNRFYRVLPR